MLAASALSFIESDEETTTTGEFSHFRIRRRCSSTSIPNFLGRFRSSSMSDRQDAASFAFNSSIYLIAVSPVAHPVRIYQKSCRLQGFAHKEHLSLVVLDKQDMEARLRGGVLRER